MNDQFREDEDERNERLARKRKERAIMALPDNLTQWADKIDNRLGPIEGRDADALAKVLRAAAVALVNLTHPTAGLIAATHHLTRSIATADSLQEQSAPIPASLWSTIRADTNRARSAIAKATAA
jgi:hypothetical protein